MRVISKLFSLTFLLLASCSTPSGQQGFSDEYYLPIWLDNSGSGEGRLTLIETNIGTTLELSSLTENQELPSSISWSPDYSRIAFVTEKDTYSSIRIVEASTNQRILFLERHCKSTSPKWSRDSLLLAFVSLDNDHCIPVSVSAPNSPPIAQLYVIDIAAAKASQLTNFSRAPVCGPNWSPDGSKIVFQAGCAPGKENLYIVAPTGANLVKLFDPYEIPQYNVAIAGVMQPKWSFDGKYLAMSANWDAKENQFGIETQLLITSEDGTNVSAPFREIQPAYWEWSPVDNRLAILDREKGLVIADPFSGKVEMMGYPAVGGVTWSPDGKALALEEEGEIYILNLATKNTRNLTADLDAKAKFAAEQWIKIPTTLLEAQRQILSSQR